jgi:hypothetical protein
MLNIKRFRNLYLAPRLSKLPKNPTSCSFSGEELPCNIDCSPECEIGNCVIHDLVSYVVKDLNCMLLVVPHFWQLET